MLRDGVCDELTNTKLCLFDGGDCCLDKQKKDTTLCKICTCRLSVDIDELRDTFKNTQVMMMENPYDFQSLILRTEKSVNDVLSKDVCSTMCLEFHDTVNGWKYDGSTNTCTCSWLKSTGCTNELTLKDVNFFDELTPFMENFVQSFIQMTKTMDCG